MRTLVLVHNHNYNSMCLDTIVINLVVTKYGQFAPRLIKDFNPIPYGLFNKRKVMGGGRSAPPSYMDIGGYFQYSFLTGVLSWL